MAKINWNAIILLILGLILIFIKPTLSCSIIWYNPITWLFYIPCILIGVAVGGFLLFTGILLLIIGVIKLLRK